MAPQYAPSLRARLPFFALIIQTIFILLFLFYVKFEFKKNDPVTNIFAEFQDVSVMLFLGFGFLATFLARYGFSGVGFNLLVASFAVQWAVLMNGFLFAFHHTKIWVRMKSLAEANLCAASALIAMGAVLGKTNPVSLLLMALLEVSGFIANRWFLQTYLMVPALDCIMLLHIFGSFFGLTMSFILCREGLEPRHEKERFDRKTGLFAMMGMLFLWMFWPSFNSILIDRRHPARKLNAIGNTYLSLAASAVTTFAVSILSSRRGKFNVLHIQNATLAGGVAVGVSISVSHEPWVAIIIGMSSGLISTLGFVGLKPLLHTAFRSHDTLGVLSVHGIPGILGWIAHLITKCAYTPDFAMALKFSMYHVCSLLVTLSVSLVLGVLTGFILKWKFWKMPQDRKCFDDQAFWEFPHLAMRK